MNLHLFSFYLFYHIRKRAFALLIHTVHTHLNSSHFLFKWWFDSELFEEITSYHHSSFERVVPRTNEGQLKIDNLFIYFNYLLIISYTLQANGEMIALGIRTLGNLYQSTPDRKIVLLVWPWHILKDRWSQQIHPIILTDIEKVRTWQNPHYYI